MQSVFHLLLVVVINITLLIAQLLNTVQYDYENDIRFEVVDRIAEECKNGTQNKKLAIIVHGWTESCEKPWAINLKENLKIHRGGCIMCMDYSKYSVQNYLQLKVNNFEGIVTLLTNKINDLVRNASFDPDNIYMFGFSFGARVVLEAGQRFANDSDVKIKQIDACEPTSIGFPLELHPGFKKAAQNVQCIHTSICFGTTMRDCHQDWNMGSCGMSQVGGSEIRVLAGRKPREFWGNGSHGLCPVFYNIAFENSFPSIQKPLLCFPRSSTYIADLSMGYLDALKNEGRFPNGTNFYAATFEEYPFYKPVMVTATDF